MNRGRFGLLMLLLLGLILMGLPVASAATWIALESPSGAGWVATSTVSYTINVTGNSSTYNCAIWDDTDGSWGVTLAQNNSVKNNTVTVLALTGVSDSFSPYTWNAKCEILGTAETNYSISNYTYYKDTVAPVITVNHPSSNGWYLGYSTPRFNFTVLENNVSYCVLNTNMNSSANTTGGYTNVNTSVYTNNTAFQLDFGDYNNWLENNTGMYKWQVVCNDTAGNSHTLPATGNYTFFVDRSPPNAFSCTGPQNNSYWTDFTPTFTWNTTSDRNFSRYTIYVNSTSTGATDYTYNVTTLSTLYKLITLAESTDTTYHWWATATDLAGNIQNGTNCSAGNAQQIYHTDETCSILYAGWNICGMVRSTAVNASTIADEVDAAYVSMYNESHQFQTHTNGSSTNAGMYFAQNQSYNGAVFIYVNTQTNWENRTWGTNLANSTVFENITNASNERWNLVPIVSEQGVSTTFGDIDEAFNGNGSEGVILYQNFTFFAKLNYSDSTLPFINHGSNFTIHSSDDIAVEYGEAIWVYANRSNQVDHTMNLSIMYD